MTTRSTVTRCPNCDSADLVWAWTPVRNNGGTGIADGRLRLNDVTVDVYLGCEECSETLAVLDADQVTAVLNALAVRPDTVTAG